jgi:hypothetical protein
MEGVESAAIALMDGEITEAMYELLSILREHKGVDPLVLEVFREMHRDEVSRGHYGDGAEGCSYCAMIRRQDG